MKIIQWILIALIFLSPYKANASRDSDSYDGNIFPIYAGNGAIVPPQTTLQESLKNKRVAVLFFYLDDSSDSKAMAPIISGLDLIWRNNIDIIALTTDDLQDKEKSDLRNDPNYYCNGLIPQTIILNSDGDVQYDKNGMINIDELNKVIGELKGIDIEDTTFECPTHLKPNWNFIKNDAINFLKTQSHGYDLIMIDDWHSSEHVYNELNLLKPFITNKTIILLHDLMHSNSTPEYNVTNFEGGEFKGTGPYGGVQLFIKENVGEYEYSTIPVNHGLTIMRKI